MIDQVSYKLAEVSDLKALIQAGNSLFDYNVIEESASEFLKDPRHHMIIAYLNHRAIGFVSAMDYVHPDKPKTLFINEASVLEDFQNQGIGREMIKRMLDHGQQMDCQEAWVATEQSNQQARKCYSAAGGKEDAESIVLIEFPNL